VAQPDVPVAADGAFALSLAPGDLWTLTTVAGMRSPLALEPLRFRQD
jgi:hypothetical protein